VTRLRLDTALVERGLFPSRARAQAAVLAGRVQVDGRPVGKAGSAVDSEAAFSVVPVQEFVSRGGLKLAHALDALGMEVAGVSALDLGASTGGFTDCLLRRGAERVIALDVGYGQLDWGLRTDPRVHVVERTNARIVTADDLPWTPDLVTCDLSFISVVTVWPRVAPLLDPEHRALVLVKPQFEVGRGQVGSGGVVRDPAQRARAVRRVAAAITDAGGTVTGVAGSGLPGPKGNREVFVAAAGPGRADAAVDLDAAIERAVADG
jgi:23S rRNA (cytidine1920-2'-O)/16S rRNA (cytidine1409-2'-O)-methyltransferase